MPARERRIARSTSPCVLVVFVLDERERRRPGRVFFLVLAEHGAVGGAEMAHARKASRRFRSDCFSHSVRRGPAHR
jgi:hypothetical protein